MSVPCSARVREAPGGHGPRVADPDTLADAAVFVTLARRVSLDCDEPTALRALVDAAVLAVPGARWVSVSSGTNGRMTTGAASDRVARDMDALQHRIGAGPSVTLDDQLAVCVSHDLATDTRWPELGATAVGEHGVHSLLVTRLAVDTAEDFHATLAMYGDHVGAFDATSRGCAAGLTTFANVVVAAVVNRHQARNLARAQSSNREIGVAMGVLMATHRLTRAQAFDLLAVTSQNSNRKLRDVATDVGDTGRLEPATVRRRGVHTPR